VLTRWVEEEEEEEGFGDWEVDEMGLEMGFVDVSVILC
jgi:hypothetical protein